MQVPTDETRRQELDGHVDTSRDEGLDLGMEEDEKVEIKFFSAVRGVCFLFGVLGHFLFYGLSYRALLFLSHFEIKRLLFSNNPCCCC